MHILTFTTLFPSALQPLNAVFVRARMERFVQNHGHRWTVVAPVPFYPRFPFPTNARYDTLARVPAVETSRGYPVYHPRYLVTPKVGMRLYGHWMTEGARRLVRRLHAADPFDVIDGHYVYPDGTAAVTLGNELGLPVILSARGTDLNLYPQLRGIGPLVRRNLHGCDHLICVCDELRQVALGLGMPGSRTSVIGNGVDASRFRPGDRATARAVLGIPAEFKVVLSVGHLIPRKGFDLLIEASARLNRDDLLLAIAGDGPERTRLERLARSVGVSDRVRFAGAVLNEDLPTWYRAADVFALASSREGWPNVLCEAQACGVPAVATRLWGIPEIIRDDSLGILVEERTADALRRALDAALSRTWDRDQIAAVGRARDWDVVGAELEAVFQSVAASRTGQGLARPPETSAGRTA